MRILLLNTFKPWGGGEWWTVVLGAGLKSMGHYVSVACPRHTETARKAKEHQLDVFPYDLTSDLEFWKVPVLMRYLKRKEIDILLCNQTRDVKLGALAGRLAGTPRIFARLGLDIVKRKPDHKIPYTRFIDGIITNTYALKYWYGRFNWFEDGFIHAVHDGIEVPDRISDVDLHRRFNLPAGTKVVVGAGRIMPQKGFDLMVDAARMAKEQAKPWRFLIAGSGKSEAALRKKAAALGVGDYIQFIGFQKDVLPIMKSADLFVLSSRSESMSNVLREAMAAKTACVATDVQGVNELIEHDRSGIIVESATAEAIYAGIDKVLSDDILRRTLAENGHRRVRTDFSLEAMVRKIESIFQNALRGNG